MHRLLLAIALVLLVIAGNLSAQRKPAARQKHATKRAAASKHSGEKPSLPSHPHLTAVARSDQDSIVVRWAPSTPLAWLAGNKFGYVVERVTMLKNTKAARATFRTLAPSPMKPWTLEEWKSRISKDDRYQAVAVQALYGKNFVPRPSEGPTAALKDAADELTNRFGFSLFAADIDPIAANGLGLRLVDKDVRLGETYSYRIRLAGRDSLLHLDTAYTIATASAFVRPPAPIGLTADPGEHSITLRWKSPVDPRGGLTAFNVYRSTDRGQNYRKLNDLPFLTATGEKERAAGNQLFTDTSAIDYVHYRYMVEGITPFADASAPAEVDGMALDLTPPLPANIKKPVELRLGIVRIDWDMPAKSSDLAGFVVSRSSFALKNYHLLFRRGTKMPSPGKGASEETRELMQLILPANARSYVDSAATKAEPYYVVGAVDTAGNLSQSLPAYSETIDTTRPVMPKGLAGTIDNNGVVHLHWRLGPERNIIGYRLLWANEPTHEFSQRINEPLPDTVFVDTVNIHTLSHYIYYRVAAVTDRYIQSPPSEIFELRRPDVVPPASPVFQDVHVTESSVLLRWVPSPSDDVERQILSRRIQGKEKWELLHTMGQKERQYLDTMVIEKIVYEYQIEAVDSTGLHSPPSVAVQARPYDSGVRDPVTELSARYIPTSRQVRLQWKYAPRRKEKYWFVIYRAQDKSPVMEYSSAVGTTREFEDRRVEKSTSYKYSIRVKAEGGAESPLSEITEIRVGDAVGK